MTGTNTELVKGKMSECYSDLVAESNNYFQFDTLAINTISDLEKVVVNDIALPVDIGFVRRSKDGYYSADIKRVDNPINESDLNFLSNV